MKRVPVTRVLALPHRVRSAVIGLLASAALLTGCVSSAPKPEWATDKVKAQSDRVLLEVTRVAMEKTGFPGGTSMDQSHLIATSGWMISLAPFRGKGFREQCEVHYTPVASGEYQVDVRVRRQKNDDLLHPLDLTYAQWEDEPDNAERAKVVVQYIKSMMADPKPHAN